MPSRLNAALSLFLSAMLAFAAPAPAGAQPDDPVRGAITRLTQAATDVDAVQQAMDEARTGRERGALTSRLGAARGVAADSQATLTAQMALVDQKIAEIGPPTPGIVDAPDIVAQRASLTQQRATIDSAIKRARLLDVEAQQLSNQIAADQAAELGRDWATRTVSPLSPAFWVGLVEAMPRDSAHVARFLNRIADDFWRGLGKGRPWIALAGLLVAIGLAGPARVALRDIGRNYAIGAAPGLRVRRSGYAVWRVANGTVLPTLAALALVQGLRWSGLTGAAAEPVLSAFVLAIGMGSLIGALAGALLMRSQPSWRLLPISDDVARALLPWSWVIALLTGADILSTTIGDTIRASGPLDVASDAVIAALRVLATGGILLALGRLRARARAAAGEPQGEEAAAPKAAASRANDARAHGDAARAWVGIVTLVAWIATIISAGALLTGYTSFSLFLTRIAIEWLAIVVAAFYLLMVTVDDVVTAVFSSDSRTGHILASGVGIRARAIDQFGILLSAALRIGLAMAAIVMLLTPFGSGVGATFQRFGTVAGGITIGDVSISPWAIIRALIVLCIGLALVRAFMRWLKERYLPTTDMDASTRNSVAMIARYTAVILAVLWCFASLGIGMERIALLVSALSVGIGFGLQAITQNFVSGLILLAERPVKIGDLVRIGNDEGDVKRISVRSTEIELADHSTLIVPNSDLITKPVLNKTLASALGRVQVQFSVPLGIDPERIRAIVLDAFDKEKAVLAQPAPSAFVDSIADGRILFNCFAHTAGPRAVYGVRSAVLFAILQRLAAEKIDVGTVPQQLQLLPAGEGTTAAKPDAA